MATPLAARLTLPQTGSTFSLEPGATHCPEAVESESMMHRVTIAIPIAVLATLFLASLASAQRGFGARPAPSGHSPSGRASGMQGQRSFGSAHPQRSGLGFRRSGFGYGLGWGWGYQPYFGYYDRGEEYARPDAEPPVSEPRQQAMFEPPRPEKLIQPILIERQGEGWVQVSGYKDGRVSGQAGPLKAVQASPSGAATPGQETAQAVSEIPPAVLVFRDGHQEEVKSYTIIGDVLFAKTDYWASGVWTRRIEIARIDVPATLKLNQDHGYRFRLPSNPQEVVIRP